MGEIAAFSLNSLDNSPLIMMTLSEIVLWLAYYGVDTISIWCRHVFGLVEMYRYNYVLGLTHVASCDIMLTLIVYGVDPSTSCFGVSSCVSTQFYFGVDTHSQCR